MSIPVSMIVVETKTSNLRSQKSTTTCSSCASGIWPCATAIRASGTSLAISAATLSIVATRLWTKKTCPSRINSRLMAAAICASEYAPIKVRIGCRSSGGVASVDISRIPVTAISRVRGIGVALIARTSTLCFSSLSFSLCSTPKRCSSSMMTRPRSLNLTEPAKSRCVPITMSTPPVSRPRRVSFDSAADWKRDSGFTVIGYP